MANVADACDIGAFEVQTLIVYLPMVSKPAPWPPLVLNGDFESGPNVGWAESSANGWDLVVDDALANGFPDGFTPRSGTWVAWLGGDENERGEISQSFTLPNRTSLYLDHYYQIHAGQACGFADYAQLMVNEEVVMEKDLCAGQAVRQWTLESINISAYAGQTVTITFLAQIDGNSQVGNYFIDDVSFSADGAKMDVQDTILSIDWEVTSPEGIYLRN